MAATLSASVLLDLSDAEELERLALSFSGLGLEAAPLVGTGDLAEAVRERGADFVLLDGRSWELRRAGLPQPPRAYLIVLLLDPDEESSAPAALISGAFDYLLRDGPGWEARAGLYFHALAALRRRLSGAFGALERRYEDLVHALPDIVYELDEEGRFTFINNSVRLLGWEPSELSGKHFSVLLHEDDARAVDRAHVLGHFKDVATGPALAPKLFNERRGLDRKTEGLELRLRRRDPRKAGDDFIASVISYGEVTAVGEYAADGRSGFVGSVGVIRDITLRRKSEDMLRKLYQAVDQLSAGVVVTDRAFRIEYVNPAFLRISGKAPQDLIGAPFFGLFRLSEERAEELVSLVNGGFEVREELDLHHGDSSLWLAVHASPVRSPSGDVTHASLISEDITGRRAMEELLRLAKDEAESANRAKSDFLAAFGHELKGPVASILASARLIAMGRSDPEAQADTIIGGAQGLLSVLSDILDYVHFERGSSTLHKFIFPLRGFMARTVEPYRAAAAAKGIAFEVGPLPEESLYSDPDRLSRALGAVLGNALRFTESGKIRVEASLEKRDGNIPHYLLSVSDTGRGFAPEDQARIFSPFVRLAGEDEEAGVGIGLPLARNIVRALGGELRLESAVGRGSVFTLLLPSGEPDQVVPSPGPAKGPRVYRLLVVDDNEVNLEFMAALLRNAGHRVDTAGNGAEALAIAEEHCPDAAILDIQMPGINGIELERRLRASKGGRYDPGLPLIALTAYDPGEIASSGARFFAVFAKPFDAVDLSAALDRGIAECEAAAFSLGSTSHGPLLVAAEDLPEYMESLRNALSAKDGETFRSAAQQLALRLETLGALGAAGAFRRLALALAWEDEVVIRSRLERYQAAWEASLGQGLSGL